MAEPERTHAQGGLSERTVSLALFAKYVALALYGIWAGIVEIPTFAIVGSPLFALAWAASVALLATLAAVGVARSWVTARHAMERWTTAAFVLTFLGYSFALIYRAGDTGSWGSAPLALIPVTVCILPTIRYYSLIRRLPGRRKRGTA